MFGLRLLILVILLMAVSACPATIFDYEKREPSLYFSEYMEGSSYNKALEIYNGTSVKQDLSDYSIHIYYNGETTPNTKIELPEEDLEPDAVFVICHSNIEDEGIGDYFVGNLQFNGNDAVELVRENKTIDCIGRIGEDPESAWTQGHESTQDDTLRRKDGVVGGDDNGKDDFDPSYEWMSVGKDEFEGFGER